MKAPRHKFTILFCLLFCASTAHSQLIINELMQSNIDCIMDDLNEFPDSWVELYNTDSISHNLNQFRIGPTTDYHDAYKLPEMTIPAHGHVLIYCDKESTGRHTNFRLESGDSCTVCLFDYHTPIDSVVNLQKQPAPNIAYGRRTDGDSIWGYQAVATPDSANCGQVYSQCLGEPIFGTPGQVFTTTTNVTLSLSLPADAPAGTVIRYTTDGSEPDSTSTVFDSSVIKRIGGSVCIRAKLFCDGYLSPTSTTQSYIFLGREMKLPVVSISMDDRYLNDPQIGIYKNASQNWRRPINFELFDQPGAPSELNQLCETRIQGNASRSAKLKSMALYANKRFGKKRFKYEFFPDQRPGEKNFKSILLRNGGNDFDYLYLRDPIVQLTMGKNADMDYQAWRPAIVYINGQYKGILNIRERSNEDNIYTNYDGLEDICMMENTWHLQVGNWNEWNEFKNFYQTTGHTWAEYEQMMDCKEYINLMVTELFFNNLDFPGNNIVFWKPHVETCGLKTRWRVLAKDCDYTLGIYDMKSNYNIIEWLYNNNYDSNHNWANTSSATAMFRNAMDDATFQQQFLDRTAIYLGDFMSYDRIRAEWDSMYNKIRDEYPIHRELYNKWWPNYSEEMSKARSWLKNRYSYFYTYLTNQYGLSKVESMTVNKNLPEEDLEKLKVTFNNVELTRPTWDGKFYHEHQVKLKGESTDPSMAVSGWEITYTSGSSTRTETVYSYVCLLYIPENGKVSANAILCPVTDLQEIQAQHENDARKYMRNGRIYIEKNGRTYDVYGRLIE